jgi:hypothetical protein
MAEPAETWPMSKILLSGFISLTIIGASYGQTLPNAGAQRVVGLFTATCLRFASDPKDLRDFMRAHHVPELNRQGQAIFLQGHQGVGFDATNSITRLAIVSEDNGVCSTFAGQIEASQIAPLVEATFKAHGFDLIKTGRKEMSGLDQSQVSSFYQVKIKDHLYKLVSSSSFGSQLSVHAAITLSP